MRVASTDTEQPEASAIRNTATVAAFTLISRATGLGRIIVIGAVLGPTFLANTFVATNTVPSIAYLAIAGTVLGAVVVPAIVRATAATGTDGATELLGRLAAYLLLMSAAASVVLLVCSPLIARLLTFGIEDAATRNRAEHLATVMLLFVAPQILLYMMATLGAAAQQARGSFALAAAAPAVENVGVIITVVAVGLTMLHGVEVDDAPLLGAVLLCAGSTLSVALHMALQLFGAARVGLPIRPRLTRRSDPLTAEITQRIRRSFIVAACPYTEYFALLALAGTVPGGVLVLQIAYSVYSLPIALGARAVSTAVLPGLSAAASADDRVRFGEKVREGMTYALIASVPPVFLIVTFASPIADLLANGRLRVGDLIASLAGCLVVMGLAQLAAGLYEFGLQGLFARLDIGGPRIAAVLALGVTLAVGLLTFVTLGGTDRLIGLSAAMLAGDSVAAVTVIVLLQRAIRPSKLSDRRWMWAATRASAAMFPLVAGGWLAVHLAHATRVGDLLIIGMASTLALVLFAWTLSASTRDLRAAA